MVSTRRTNQAIQQSGLPTSRERRAAAALWATVESTTGLSRAVWLRRSLIRRTGSLEGRSIRRQRSTAGLRTRASHSMHRTGSNWWRRLRFIQTRWFCSGADRRQPIPNKWQGGPLAAGARLCAFRFRFAAGANAQPWDPSVKALTAYPQVLAQMTRICIDSELGNAYYKPTAGRTPGGAGAAGKRAQAAGNLQSTPQEGGSVTIRATSCLLR